MKVTEKGPDMSASHVKPCLAQLENMLQELRQCEERKRQQSVESISVTAKQKLLSDQLKETKDELAAIQASKAKLCEKIGALKETKEHQTKQLNKYKLDLQTARESHEAMTKKMEKMKASTGTIKQQYIRSLASRIKSSAQALQQLNVLHGVTSNVQICSELNQNKRKRMSSKEGEYQVLQPGSKPEQAGIVLEIESQSGEVQLNPAAKKNHDVALENNRGTLLATSDVVNEQKIVGSESENRIQDLLAQITKLESERLASKVEYAALKLKYGEILDESKKSAEDIKEKDFKIEELEQMLKIARSTPPADSNPASVDKSAIDGRLKMLEDNLSQMNGYADQLEVVIAQCPSCTLKLQNESTQDSVANKAE